MNSYSEDPSTGIITVNTPLGSYQSRKLVLTVGAWAPAIYGDKIPPQLDLHVERRVLYWFDPSDIEDDYKVLLFSTKLTT